MTEWVCGWCQEGKHAQCPVTAGCGCTGQEELVCACADRNHKKAKR